MPDIGSIVPWLPAIGGALSLLPLWGAMRSGRRRRLVDNLPTSKTTGVFIGFVELKGTAETSEPLTSFLAGAKCVHYTWSVDEHWSRTVTESYTDNEGKSQTRTRHESGWKTVASGGETVGAFYVQDDCGVVLVRPEGADIELAAMFDETCGRGDPLYYAKGPALAVSDSDHRRRFSEKGIVIHAPLFVLGQARERADVVAAEIARDKAAPMFLISTRTERQISSGFAWAFWLWVAFGLALAVAGMLLRDAAFELDLAARWPFLLVAAAGYGLAAALAWAWMVFNSLVDLRQRVRQGWSQVDVQLKRRHDLIPNLVSAVTGIRDHEQKMQVELAALRAQLGATPPGVAGPDYGACGRILIGIKENYPELTAQGNFAALQQELVNTEQRIALARGYFNEIATHYNTRLEIVPDRFIATLAHLQPQPLMAANDFERAPVSVTFAS